MIEVDGLTAAVIPTPNASPSADAPAEFAAAMSLVEGETGQSGAEPGVEQQLATELVEAPVGTDSLLEAELPVDTDVLLDTHSPDGRELDLSSLAAVAPAPDPAASGPTLSRASDGDVGEVPIEDGAASSPAPVEKIDVPIAATTEAATIAPPEADSPAVVTPSAPIDASVVVAESDPAPAVDTAAAPGPAVDPFVADSMVASEIAVSTAPSIQSARAVVADDTAVDEAGEVGEIGADVPEAQVAVMPDPANAASAATTSAATTGPAVPSGGVRLDGTAPELAGDGIEALTSTPDSPAAVIDVATATRAPDSAPTVDAPAPSLPPAAVSAPAPRVDVNVAEVVDVPPTPSPPTPEATPTQQVAEALREVRRLADGSHRLSLQLHPEELGAVQLEVAIRDGQLHVRAVAETEAARSALERNLPELRSDLRDAGVRAGSLEVGPDASGRDRSDSPTRDTRTEVRSESGAEDHLITTPEPSTSSGLDIRL